MLRENRTRILVEAIDDAIEQAEDLGLPFVAGILMMARLVAFQRDVVTAAMRKSDQHH
jgi:DhnA family fructose-bisphosphate aldolase class Ia